MVDKVKQAADKAGTSSVYEYESKRSILKNVQAQRTLFRKLRAYGEGKWNQKTTSQRGLEATKLTRLLRFTGSEGLATFIELFMVDAAKAEAKRKAKDKKEESEDQAPQSKGASAASRKSQARVLGVLRDIRRDTMVTRVMVQSMGGDLSSLGSDVRDIKSLIMPKTFNVKVNKRVQGVQYNPLAPEGNQLRLMENNEVTGVAPGSRIKEKAVQKAAYLAASQAFRIKKKDDEREARNKKRGYSDPKEMMRRGDPVLSFLIKIDKRLDKIEDLLEKGGGKGGGLGAVGTVAASAAGAAAGGLAAKAIPGIAGFIAANIKPFGIASIPLAALYYAQDQAKKAMEYVEGGGDIDSYTGYNPFVLMAQRGRKKDKWWYPKEWDDKRNAGYKAREQKNAAAGRTRGGVASSKGMSLFESIAHYKKMSEDPKLPEAQRDAYRRIYETLLAQSGPMLDARNARITGGLVGGGSVVPKATAPSRELVSDIERDSDTWDTNYATSTAPAPKTSGPSGRYSRRNTVSSVGGTGTLMAGTYESRLQALGEVIASHESGGDYNIYNKGAGHGYKKGREDLSKMTLAEYMRRGNLPSKHPDKLFATGKYQIIPKTMALAIEKLNLDPNTTLTPATQEYIFREFLTKSKRPAIHNYLSGKSNDQTAAMVAVAQEWASVGVPMDMQGAHRWVKKGESYYADDGINRAHTKPEAVLSALTPVKRPDGSLLAGQPYGAPSPGSQSASDVNITPVMVNNKTVNNTIAQRPMPKATAVSNDPSLVRSASRDVTHPVFVG
jgi:hypothetical protein